MATGKCPIGHDVSNNEMMQSSFTKDRLEKMLHLILDIQMQCILLWMVGFTVLVIVRTFSVNSIAVGLQFIATTVNITLLNCSH